MICGSRPRLWKHSAIALLIGLASNVYLDSSISAFCLDQPPSSAPRTPRRNLGLASFITEEREFDKQIQIALEAVRKACAITTRLQQQVTPTEGTITKQDESPVTIADFASQAVILKHLKENFPEDLYLAEESSDTLTPRATKSVQLAANFHDEAMLKECIDLGRSYFHTKENDPKRKRRVWCLDPIDGTKGFLRKEQYCVALCLLEDGCPKIGILGCPNLPMVAGSSQVGCIFVAERGRGCYQLPLEPGRCPPVRLPCANPNAISDTTEARFCVGVEQGFADPIGRCKDMAKLLHGNIGSDGEILHSIRVDSQAKYGIVARGEAEFYVRLPNAAHREWIWDVAAGVIILEEAGGLVTDAEGRPLDFSEGAKLTSNGILGAASPILHEALLKAYNDSRPSEG